MKNKKALVIKNNELVERTRYRLSVNEQRIILTLISKISPKDTDFQRYTFGIEELYNLLKVSSQNKNAKRRTLKKILLSLQRNIIEIVTRHPDHGGEILRMPAWIESPDFDWNRDKITLRVSEHLKSYLLQLKNKFTRYSLDEVARFKCAHSFRFLEFCKNNEPRPRYHSKIINGRYVNIKIYELLELRLLLGIPKKIYPQLFDFRRRVLEASQREVNMKSSSYFEFKMLKNPVDRRRTKAVKLLIFGDFVWPIDVCRQKQSKKPRPILLPEPVTPPPKSTIDPRDEELRLRMLQLKVSPRQVITVLKSDYDRGQILSAIEALEDYQRNHEIKWPNRILNSALLDAWVSKREVRRQEEAQKTAKKLATIQTLKNLEKGLAEREKQEDKISQIKHDQAIESYQKRLEICEEEFYKNADKANYVLNLYNDFAGLNERTRMLIENKIKGSIESGADFDEVYFESGQMIFGFLMRSQKV